MLELLHRGGEKGPLSSAESTDPPKEPELQRCDSTVTGETLKGPAGAKKRARLKLFGCQGKRGSLHLCYEIEFLKDHYWFEGILYIFLLKFPPTLLLFPPGINHVFYRLCSDILTSGAFLTLEGWPFPDTVNSQRQEASQIQTSQSRVQPLPPSDSHTPGRYPPALITPGPGARQPGSTRMP